MKQDKMIIILKKDGSTQLFFNSAIAEYDLNGKLVFYSGPSKKDVPEQIIVSKS